MDQGLPISTERMGVIFRGGGWHCWVACGLRHNSSLQLGGSALPWTTLLGVTSFIIRLCFLRLFNSDCLLLPSTSCVILLGTVVSDVLVWPGFSAKTSLTHTGTQNFFLERPCKLVLEVLLLDLGMSVVGFGVRPQAACTEVWGMLGLDLYRVRRYSAMQCLLI